MSSPTAYTVSYYFTGWQASNPAKPLPAPKLDVELANVSASIASLISALADVRRADGGLQNGVVALEALDPQLQALLGGDPRVLVTDINPEAFANQDQAAAGVSPSVIMTPLATAWEIDALRGFASQAAAQAGAADNVVMSPLRTKEQLDALRGFASQAEAEAMAATNRVTSPLAVKQAIEKLRPALKTSTTMTFGSIAAGAGQTQNLALSGANLNSRVSVGLPPAGLADGLILTAWVSATNVVSCRLYNVTGSAIEPGAIDLSFTMMRY